MQLPFRPKQKMKQLLQESEPVYLTHEGIKKLEYRLAQIQQAELPQAIEDVRRTGEFGDFSENAEYQEAKGRMRKLHDQVTSIQEKLKQAILIEVPLGEDKGIVQMGSTVLVRSLQGPEKQFQIVGPQETDPLKGRLSFKSPLGSKLMGRSVGEEIQINTDKGMVSYRILSVH
ncbi:GreA/GreB family elongation factor [Candidatus Uhrbacteria bacterium]|nr:GreA/GreB family elongation factor [Candidatus Uhrbacteria bacterium]